MTDKPDKKAESIAAAKNLNKHLSDVFAELAKKDEVLRAQSAQLSYAAQQCGDLKIEVYVASQRQAVSLKAFLEAASKALTEARS